MVISMRLTSACAMIGADSRRRHSRGAALPALARIGERLLRGAFGDADALQPDAEPRPVHHGEHAGHAGVLFADDKARRPAVVAENHRAGRRAVDAELVLDRMRAHVVAGAGRAVGVEQKFGDHEQGDAARARRRVGQAREHEVDDVVGEVVLAVGDEDLLAGDAIGAVGGAFGARAQRADVGAGLRLGELHRGDPFAGDELAEVGALERLAAMGGERVDGRHAHQRADAERHGGARSTFRRRRR